MKLNFWKKDAADELPVVEASVVSYASTDPAVHVPAPEDNLYNRISRCALYVAVSLMPLFFLPVSTNVLDVNKQMLLVLTVGVALVAWLLGVVSSGWLSWRRNYLDYGVVGFLGVVTVATVFSVDKFRSLFGTNIALSFSLFTLIGLSLYYVLVVNNMKDRGTLFRSLFGVSVIVALLYGLLQVFGWYVLRFDFSMARAFNTVGSINTLGLLAAIMLPYLNKMSVHLRWLRDAHLDKAGTVLVLALLLIINWQTLWTVAIAGMIGVVVFDAMRGEKFKIAKILLPMTVIVLGVFMMIVNFNFANIRNNFPVEVAPSFTLSRDVATGVLNKSPLVGYGPENFVLAFDQFGASRIANSSLSNVRFFDGMSEIMNLVTQMGVVGVVGLLFLLWALWKTVMMFKAYCAEYIGSDFLKEDAGVFASLVAALVGLFFYPYNLTLMFVLYTLFALAASIAWTKHLGHYNIEDKTSLSLVASLAFIGGLILVLVGGYFGGTVFLSDMKYAKALREGSNPAAAGIIVEAINLNRNDDRFYRTGSQIALSLLSDAVNNQSQGSAAERQQRVQNYTSSAVTLAQRATQIGPRDAVNWANLGNVYQNLLALLDNADRLSEEAYLKAAELRPGDASYLNRIGMLYLSKYELLRQLAPRTSGANLQRLVEQATDAINKSEENLKKAVEMSPNFGVAIYNLGAVYDRQGKVAESIRELEKIIPANPNQPGLIFELGLLYYRANRKNEALQQLERAILLAPDYSNARWYAALIYEERKEFDKAIEYLEHTANLDANKDNTVLQTKLQQLREGRVANPPVPVLDQQPLN